MLWRTSPCLRTSAFGGPGTRPSRGTDAFADKVSTEIPQEEAEKYGNVAQSNMLTVEKSGDSDSQGVVVFVKGASGSKANYDLSIDQIQEVDEVLLAEALADAGLDSEPTASARSFNRSRNKNV